jgi:cystathionine beta-lyase/cystathionine gamma-synthase
VSLGGCETTIIFPAETSHAQMLKEERERIGISDTLIRMSVGIEDEEDLIADMEQAFQKLEKVL